MSINRVNISGHLTRDPELRMTPKGTQVLSFGIAVNDRRLNRETNQCESLQASQGYHNSWLTLHEDKKNKYDPTVHRAGSFRTAIARGAARTAASSSTISMMSAGIWT